MRITTIEKSPRAFERSSDATSALEAANNALKLYADALESVKEVEAAAAKMSATVRARLKVDEMLQATAEMDIARTNAFIVARASYLALVAQIPEPKKETFQTADVDTLRHWNRNSADIIGKLPLKHN